MKNTFLALSLVATLCLSLAAEPIYVRNRPFKGPASGAGQAMLVGLKEFAAALELNVVEKNGGFLVDTEEGEPKEGEVLVNGKSLMTVAGETGPAVNLKEFADAAGLIYRPNKSMGTIDISKAPGGKSSAAASSPGAAAAAAATPGQAIILNQTTPGVYINLDSLLVPGKFTFIYLYKDGEKDKGYKDMYAWVDRFLKNPDIVLYKINIGYPGSPMAKSFYEQYAPRLLAYGKDKRFYTFAGGHGIPTMEHLITDMKNYTTWQPKASLQKY